MAKDLIEQIESMAPNTEDWAAKVTVLIENVEHHAEEEEKAMFPKVRTATTSEARATMAERMEARKADLGAPTMADKEGLSKEQLTDLAKEQEIPGRSSMSADELRAAVAPK